MGRNYEAEFSCDTQIITYTSYLFAGRFRERHPPFEEDVGCRRSGNKTSMRDLHIPSQKECETRIGYCERAHLHTLAGSIHTTRTCHLNDHYLRHDQKQEGRCHVPCASACHR